MGIPSQRSFHQMVALRNKLYVFGGCPAKGRLADLHRFDPHTSKWTKLPQAPMAGRGGAGFAAVGVFPSWGEGKLMVLGGFAVLPVVKELVQEFCCLAASCSQVTGGTKGPVLLAARLRFSTQAAT